MSVTRASRAAYLGRTVSDKQAVIAFLSNLVLFKIEEEEGAAAAGATSALQTLIGAPTPTQQIRIKPKGFRIVLNRE